MKDTELVTLTDARRAIGISRSRLYEIMQRRKIQPIIVGQIGFLPGAIVKELVRVHRAWLESRSCHQWQKKTGHRLAEAS